jgi:hypothetical protein
LRANDAIARDGAERIAGFADDVDGQTRGAAWDVGADEFIAACGLDSQCDDGVACTDDRCVAGNCLNADTCGAGQSCSVESDRCEQVPGTGQPGVPPVPKIVTVDPLRSR